MQRNTCLVVDWTLTLSDIVVSVVTLVAAFFAAWFGGRIAFNAAINAVHEEARLEQQRRTEDNKQRQRERDEDQRRQHKQERDQGRIAITNLYNELVSNAILLEGIPDPIATAVAGEPAYRRSYVVLDVWIHLDLTAYDAASPYFVWLGADINEQLRVSRLKIKSFNAIATYNNMPKPPDSRPNPMMRSMSNKWLPREEIEETRVLLLHTSEAIREYIRRDLGEIDAVETSAGRC